jgi:hypothetical protein
VVISRKKGSAMPTFDMNDKDTAIVLYHNKNFMIPPIKYLDVDHRPPQNQF